MQTRSWIAIVGTVMTGGLLVTGVAGPVTAQVTERVSVDSLGVQGNSASGGVSSLSADGRLVAFLSGATNLVSGDTNGATDVFVRDRQTGTTVRVSVDSAGAQHNGNSSSARISADGRFVAFESEASLVSGDTNGQQDVFVRDLEAGTTERVSVDSAGAQANGLNFGPTISADGRYVVFASHASNLVAGDTNGVADVFVHDRQSGTTERVSVDSSGAQANGHSNGFASITADGRIVAYSSVASNLVSGDTNATWDAFLRDRENGTTELVSVDSNGVLANSGSAMPSTSSDGRYVVFQSWASNLVSGDTNASSDVFVHDRQSGTTERVSVTSTAAQANGDSVFPSISADGRHVAFSSNAFDLVPDSTNPWSDVFVRDRLLGSTERASVDSAGVQANHICEAPSISANGRSVVFLGIADNLVADDTNEVGDSFVRNLCSDATAAAFSGDGINVDVILPVSAVRGSSWSAPLTLGHSHGAGGPLSLKVRTATINGPNVVSPFGGRPTEVLIRGPLLAVLAGTHDGSTGDIAPQPIPPDDPSLVGLSWAAQYVVVGGGFGDFSQAVAGVIGCD